MCHSETYLKHGQGYLFSLWIQRACKEKIKLEPTSCWRCYFEQSLNKDVFICQNPLSISLLPELNEIIQQNYPIQCLVMLGRDTKCPFYYWICTNKHPINRPNTMEIAYLSIITYSWLISLLIIVWTLWLLNVLCVL